LVIENAKLAYSDIRQAVEPQGRNLDPDQWTEEIAGAVRDFETRTITARPRATRGRSHSKAQAPRQGRRLIGHSSTWVLRQDKTPPVSPFDGVPREALRAFVDALKQRIAGQRGV